MVKYRIGFVSNSSSSSYICDICSEIFSGWDIGFEEFGLYECINGHVFCESHAKETPYYTKERLVELYNKEKKWLDKETIESIDEMIEKDNVEGFRELLVDIIEDERYDVTPEQCPLCRLDEINDSDRIDYLMIEAEYTYGKLLKEIRERFKTYDKFKQYLKDNVYYN